MSDDNNKDDKDGASLPPIIKKIKKGGHGHHGGAWKIAYADFVTAMMAFFLLMWLVASLNKAQKAGIAEYFQQPIKVAISGGKEMGNRAIDVMGGGDDINKTKGQVESHEAPKPKQDFAATKQDELNKLKNLKSNINLSINKDPSLAGLKDQMLMDITQEGLRIQLIDNKNQAMFPVGSDKMNPEMETMLKKLARLLNSIPNKLSIQGHTDAQPYNNPDELAYTNWELSTQRANAARRFLIQSGLNESKVIKVSGFAETVLFNPKDPRAPENRRISIIVMKKDAELQLLKNK